MHALDALGNPVRREILERLLERPRSVGQLAAEFPVSRPAISRHLRLLEDAGLVTHARHGARHTYAIRPEGFAAVESYVSKFWDEALTRFRMLAENLPEAP